MHMHMHKHMSDIEAIDFNFLESGHDIFRCNIYKYESSDDKEIKKHLRNHIQDIKESDNTETTHEVEMQIKTTKTVQVDWCPLCGEEGLNENEFSTHMQKHLSNMQG